MAHCVVTPRLTWGGPRAKSAAMNRPGLFCTLALSPFLLASIGCDKPVKPEPTQVTSAPPKSAKLDKLTRAEFNKLAPELALPLFWAEDRNKDGALDPDELAVYWGLDRNAARADYVTAQGFTPKMTDAYDRIVKQKSVKDTDPRRTAVKKELEQGRVTLVATDLSKASPQEKKFASAILKASELIETLYAKQEGTAALAAKVPADDAASKTLFFRAQGPKCEAPLTQDDKNCGALAVADMPQGKISGLYPPDLLAKPKFCDEIGKKDKMLVDPFTVVTSVDGQLKASPYTDAYKDDMAAVATQLKAAADALEATEPALVSYLQAAAKSFGDNMWWSADEAWAKMDSKNSKYYLRIGPDEVYHEPCSTKALFHVSFGLINQGSLKWQSKLDPRKTEMENAIAALAGAPYKAREVSFKLPDFVDITLNAGDSRNAFGATIGQSLPNFGPVANQGRGRTVAMTNFYTDPDSIASSKEQAESLFCKDVMAKWTSEQEPQLMSTVLHEAAHNLGPAHQYKTNGKIDREAFGGPLASTLEELKAQTAALYFTDWLIDKKEITREEADKAHIRDVFWGLGHISRGMYGPEHHPNNYSQLAAIQLGWLMKNGAVVWKDAETAANGKDKGCFSLDLTKMPDAIRSLMIEVAQVKGKGDKARAEALIKEYVDVDGDKKKTHEVITSRMTRAPKASFVYTVKLD